MVDSIQIKDFTNFHDNKLEFSKGVNVLIGENGTGKTHILKILSATINANNKHFSGPIDSKLHKMNLLAESLVAYFKPDRLANLIRKVPSKSGAQSVASEKPESVISVSIDEALFSYNISSNTDGPNLKTYTIITEDDRWEDTSSLYIPPREMFSLFEGFIGLTEKREISFDETYISLAKSLNVPLLKSGENPLQSAIDVLEKKLNFQVVQKNGRFYIKEEQRETEAHLVAEGYRKLASIMYLILNGELKKDSVLFWDEPESNLNPVLIKVVAEFIMELSKCGIQVFIATHDYLLTHLLSLHAEYREQKNAPDMKFFSLSKGDSGINIEEGDVLSAIENNPILDEYAGLYDLEQLFLGQSLS